MDICGCFGNHKMSRNKTGDISVKIGPLLIKQQNPNASYLKLHLSELKQIKNIGKNAKKI